MLTAEQKLLKQFATDGVARDWVDLRDRLYEPSLNTLGAGMVPNESLFSRTNNNGAELHQLTFGIRQQGNTGRCVGFALAALIDVQRRLQAGDSHPLSHAENASAEMLYHMARFHDQYTMFHSDVRDDGTSESEEAVPLESRQGGVRSLRSVVKGFYHHGVFQNDTNHQNPLWKSDQTIPTVRQAKAARSIGLGAYYRLRPILNHYHSALNDTGTILVSASIHEGWLPQSVRSGNGVIDWVGQVGEGTQHAFVIIGYTAEGFLVLNSWGEQWGGIDGYQGVGLWSYSDWARNVIDGWVVRLGVSAPSAFDVSIGEQGLANAYGTVRSSSTPCLELMGHYIHVDDGYYTELSAYPSNREMMDETLKLLPEAIRLGTGAQSADTTDATDAMDQSIYPRKGLLLWISGSLEGMKESFETAVRRKRVVNSHELYPFFVFWCNDFVQDSILYLRDKFSIATSIAGRSSEHSDRLIENSVRGAGRAFWREVESCARRGIWDTIDPDHTELVRGEKRGHLGEFLTNLYDEIKEDDGEIHIVVDGAGALVFDEFIRMFDYLTDTQQYGLAARITTLNFALPAIDTERAQERILPLIDMVNFLATQYISRQPDGTYPTGWMPPAQIHIPSEEIEQRICNGDYGKSILHLIANAFEDRDDQRNGGGRALGGPGGRPKPMLGMANARKLWHATHSDRSDKIDPFCVLKHVQGIEDKHAKIDQIQLTRDPGLDAAIMRSVEYHATHYRNRRANPKNSQTEQ